MYWQPFEFPYFIWKLKVRFFVHCTKFSNHYNFLNIKKVSIVGKPQPSGILKLKIF